MQVKWNGTAVLLLGALGIGIDDGVVLAVRHHQGWGVLEDLMELMVVIDQEVTGGRAHIDLNTGNFMRIDALDFLEIVVARAQVKAVIDYAIACGQRHLVMQGRNRGGRREGVRHIHKRGDTS